MVKWSFYHLLPP
jgi:hypothetical protein